MLKDLLKEGGLYTLANFLTKGISLLLIPFYTAYFTPSDYGLYDILTVFGAFAANIFSLQLNQGLARFVAEPTNSENKKIEYASTAFVTYLLLFILLVLISLFFSDNIISILSPNSHLKHTTFYLAIAVIFFNNIFYFLNVYLRFIRQVKLVALFSFLQSIFGILLLMYFVFKKDLGIDSFFIPYLIVTPPIIITQLYFLRGRLKPFFNSKKLKDLLNYSTPLIGGAIALIIMNLTDRVFINDMLGETDLGIYGIGIKFASIITIIVSGFSMALSPLIFESHNNPNTKKELSEMFNLFIAVGVGGAFLLSLFSVELVNYFTTFSYHKASTVLPLMLFTTLLTGLIMFAPGLQIKKKTGVITLLTIIFACLNIVLNYFLIPKYGIIGAATSTLIATSLYGMVYFFLSLKNYTFVINLKKVIVPFLIVGISFILLHYLELNAVYVTIFKLVIIAVYISIIYKIGMLKRVIKKYR